MSKMSLKPPTKTAEEFIREANQSVVDKVPQSYPWEDPRVREDVIKSVNLRLAEPLLLKLQYVSQQTRKSQQELIREALAPYLDKIIEEL
jgi:hypothetical protein